MDGISVGSLTPAALLGLAVLLLLLGKIVPRRTLEDTQATAERWRQAYETEREARLVSDLQNRELMEIAKTTQSMLTSIYQATEPKLQHPDREV